MPAATPRRIQKNVTLQHELSGIISTLNAGSLCHVMLPWQYDECFICFGQNGLK